MQDLASERALMVKMRLRCRRGQVQVGVAVRGGHRAAGRAAGADEGVGRAVRAPGPPDHGHLRRHGAAAQHVRPGVPVRARAPPCVEAADGLWATSE